ncbi:MAG TPA: hypothetical protein VM536_19255 [Chloroflexia bacterium]|nr:hypothetical protein [Chloroflexia bacterium]
MRVQAPAARGPDIALGQIVVLALLLGLAGLGAFTGARWPAMDLAAPAGALLAPVSVVLLATLLPRRDLAPAAAAWGGTLAWVLCLTVAAASLIALAGLPAPIGSAAVPLLAALLAYTAGRRAARAQGFSDRVAVGMGVTLGVFGVVTLSGGSDAVATVAGLAFGVVGASLAPAPPAPTTAIWAAPAAVLRELVFVAPMSLGLLLLMRAFA